MAEPGFLGRWSQRKLAQRQGRPLEEPKQPRAGPQQPLDPDAPKSASPAGAVASAPSTAASAPHPAAGRAPAVPAPAAARQAGDGATGGPAAQPTMQDVAGLHKDSDFRPFVARAVQPEVRNAALKKLFSDPHFNVMDGLDTYIDDYALPDPLPAAMLRQMASAQFLRLFDDKGQGGSERRGAGGQAGGAPPGAPREDADGAASPAVAQSTPEPDSATGPTGTHDDEDPDLRLQPDDAAGPARPGRGTG